MANVGFASTKRLTISFPGMAGITRQSILCQKRGHTHLRPPQPPNRLELWKSIHGSPTQNFSSIWSAYERAACINEEVKKSLFRRKSESVSYQMRLFSAQTKNNGAIHI